MNVEKIHKDGVFTSDDVYSLHIENHLSITVKVLMGFGNCRIFVMCMGYISSYLTDLIGGFNFLIQGETNHV